MHRRLLVALGLVAVVFAAFASPAGAARGAFAPY